ncbi:MAG: hypothetical protein ACI8PZ_005316 [Myxococcota bacterium]|jgi:hypothetical protein
MGLSLGFGLFLAAGGCTPDESKGPPAEPAEHRANPADCDAGRPTWTVEPSAGYGAYEDLCAEHEDCTAGDDGRCTTLYNRGGAYLDCTYTECLTDDDCAGVCACAADEEQAHNTCLPAGDCETDDDCGDDYCSPSVTSCGPGWGLLGHFCHTRDDECRDDADCSGSGYCAFSQADEHWVCAEGICVG